MAVKSGLRCGRHKVCVYKPLTGDVSTDDLRLADLYTRRMFADVISCRVPKETRAVEVEERGTALPVDKHRVWGQAHVTACEACGGPTGTTTIVSESVFSVFPFPVLTLHFSHVLLSVRADLHDDPDQAAHYQILRVQTHVIFVAQHLAGRVK
jgi:hypothetical protein